MPPEHSAWAPFPRHAGQGLQAFTAHNGTRQRSPPPTRNWRQVAPGPPATPNRHFNTAVLRRGRSSWQAPPHPTHPQRATTRVLQTESTKQRAAHPTGADAWTSPPYKAATEPHTNRRLHRLRPPNRLPTRPLREEAAGGMRCCGGVLKRGKRQVQAGMREVYRTGPPLLDGTGRPESRPAGERLRARHNRAPASDPRTACPPDRFDKKRSAACGAAEVC